MPFSEEWQLWNAYGWSTLSYGLELWAWDKHKEIEKVEARYLKTAFGVGANTSYLALCWYAGILPARYRIRMRAFNMVGRLVRGNRLMKEAWEMQWEARARLGEDISAYKKNNSGFMG